MKMLYALWTIFILGVTLGEGLKILDSCSELKPQRKEVPFMQEEFKGRWNALVLYHTNQYNFDDITCCYIDVSFEQIGSSRYVTLTGYLLYEGSNMTISSIRKFSVHDPKISYWIAVEGIESGVYSDVKTDYNYYAFISGCSNIDKIPKESATIYTRAAVSSDLVVEHLQTTFEAYDEREWVAEKHFEPEECVKYQQPLY